MNILSKCRYGAVLFAALAITATADANPVTLQSGTATFSQDGFSVDNTIDGVLSTANAAGAGWAIALSGAPDATKAETAAYEVGAPLTSAGGFNLTFSLFAGGFGNHSLGLYRLSYTTDDQSLFADGLDTNGDVAANWIELTPLTTTSDNVNTSIAKRSGNNMILATGAADADDLETQTITASTGPLAAPITGFRLETLEDTTVLGASGGPGRADAGNGNFVLREFSVDAVAVPEPSSLGLLCMGGLVLIARRRRA